MADADRLQALQDDFSRTLEAKITGLMAHVAAAQEINRQLQQADAEIALAEAEAEAIDGEIEGFDAGSDDHEAGLAQVEALRHAIQETEEVRVELMNALSSLVGEFNG